MPVVRPRPAFERAVTDRLLWLQENAPEEWLDRFLSALEELEREIERSPEASPVVMRDERVVLRQRRLPGGLPYFVYYTHPREDPISEVFLSRLFHERQRRPRLRPARWPW
ncbi:MAG TPA: hypothetical protein VF998_10905 [Candidatus Limnocylindria bacterium]